MIDIDECKKILAGAECYFVHALMRFDKETEKDLSFDDVAAFQKGFLSGVTSVCAFLSEKKNQGDTDEELSPNESNVN